MIIVRNDSEVLEEIYPDQHAYHLANGSYIKTPQTTVTRNLISQFQTAPCDAFCRQLLNLTNSPICH